MRTPVIYWSGTGNTEAMAEAVSKGIGDGQLVSVDLASAATVSEHKAFALGCPSMGAEELEEDSMEPFVKELETLVKGKHILLFGSYDWGDGEWMRTWEERMIAAGATLISGEGIIANNKPDESVLAQCEAAGKELASFA